MCVGTSTRVSQGGSIAILRPSSPTSILDTGDEMRLLFSNGIAALRGRAGTQVEFQGWKRGSRLARDGCWVVIHRDGDLSASAAGDCQALPPSDPFYLFPLDEEKLEKIELSHRLNLGVGDAGIVGRRVSVMTRTREGPLTVAEGIIGWN